LRTWILRVLADAVLDASLCIVRAQGRLFLGALLDIARTMDATFCPSLYIAVAQGSVFLGALLRFVRAQGRRFLGASVDIACAQGHSFGEHPWRYSVYRDKISSCVHGDFV
jgi:hypothetical protein